MSDVARYKVRDPEVVHETIDGETVIVNLTSGNYYSLQGVGADIWALLCAGVAAGAIVESIERRYSGDPAEIEAGVGELIRQLVAEELVTADGEAPIDAVATEIAAAADGDRPPFAAPTLETHQDMQELLLLDPIHEVDQTGWPNAAESEEDG